MKRALAAGAALAGLVLAFVLMVPTGPPPMPPVALTSGTDCRVAGTDPIAKIAYQVGWRGDDIGIAVAVAHAESGLKPTATNLNTNGSVDYGLFQINSIHAAILARGDWRDPLDNARMAFMVWTDAGGSWQPWVTYNTGAYRQYLTPVKQTCTPAPVAGRCPNVDTSRYRNGQIPARALCPLWADRDHRLAGKAANSFDALAKAYTQHFGSKPCITDSYRSYAAQVDVRRRKPGLAAVPGTSNHGWGLALDLGCGLQTAGTAQDAWMHRNAPTFGWHHPAWAEPSGSKPEPWHFEYKDAK